MKCLGCDYPEHEDLIILHAVPEVLDEMIAIINRGGRAEDGARLTVEMHDTQQERHKILHFTKHYDDVTPA